MTTPTEKTSEISAIHAEISASIGYNASNAPALLNCAEAAKILGVQQNTLAIWRSTGRYELPFVRVGRAVRYRIRDIATFLHNRTAAHTGQEVGDDA